MRQDLTYAFRTLLKNPGFTAVVVISIALGIAANTTVFSIVNGLLLGEIPVREPGRLVSFAGGRSFSWPDYVDYREGTKAVFEDVSGVLAIVPASVGGRGEPERAWGQLATGNYFNVIGAEPALGRTFLPEEDEVPGRNPVVVLSHGLWTRRFAADPAIAGKDVLLNGQSYKVIGVMRPGFTGSVRAIVADFWVPLAMMDQLSLDIKRANVAQKRDTQWLLLNARLKPGVSREQATAAVQVIQKRIDDQFHKGQQWRKPMKLTAGGELMAGMGDAAVGLTVVLMIVVGVVLLIACANVANILLARATARQKEIAVRLAVGASRFRLMRQLLTESVILACMGAGLGAVAATWAAKALSSFRLPLPLPIALDFTPDARVFAATAVLAILTGILFGFAPALRATRPDLVNSLRHSVTPLGGHRSWGLRNILVVAQVALSLVLLVGTGLFLRSLQNASSIDVGMQAQGVLLTAFDPKLNHYTPERSKLLLRQLRERTSALPGVQSVSYVDSLPLSIGGTTFMFKSDKVESEADVYTVGARYFETVGTPILRGREFSLEADANGGVAIINETLAAKLFPGTEAIGRQITSDNKPYRIVGIAKNSKSRTLGEGSSNIAYLYLEAAPETVMSFYGISLMVKGAATMQTLRQQIHALDPNLPVFNANTMQDHVDKALLLPKVCALLLGVFGGAGLLLAAVGLYGVMSYSVRSRTREIGIRMALGAPDRGVLSMITRQGMTLAGIGLAVGLAISLAVTQFLTALLYGVSAYDTITFVAVPATLLGIALLAVLLPARRAARVDPMVALRYE